MAKTPVTIHLDPQLLAEVDRRSRAEGRTRSQWMGEVISNAITGELLPIDALILEQMIKMRSMQEILIETLVKASAENDEERLAVMTNARVRSERLFDRFLSEAAKRIKS